MSFHLRLVTTATMVLAIHSSSRAEDMPELQLAGRLEEARSRGVKLFNGGDVNGCLELFIKAMQDAAKVLDDHRELTDSIRSAFRDADMKTSGNEQAIVLNEFLVEFIKDVRKLDSAAEFVKRGDRARSSKEPDRAARLYRRALVVHVQKTADSKNDPERKPPARDAAMAYVGLGRLEADAKRNYGSSEKSVLGSVY